MPDEWPMCVDAEPLGAYVCTACGKFTVARENLSPDQQAQALEEYAIEQSRRDEGIG